MADPRPPDRIGGLRRKLSHPLFRVGAWLIKASLPADEGATVRAALDRIADSFPLKDEEDNYRWPDQRRADALVDGIGSGDEASGGTYSTTLMQQILCDARIQAVVRNRAGETVDVSSPMRTAPPWLRRPMVARDGGCRFRGCANRAFVEAHHIEHWPQPVG